MSTEYMLQYTAAEIDEKLGQVGEHAKSATKLDNSRTINLTGDATGSASFNGTADANITVTVADDSHNHVISNVDGLQTALDGKAGLTHSHEISHVEGLQTALDGKSSSTHNHDDKYDTKGSSASALASAKTYADNAATKVKNDLLNGAGGAYDTLKELGDLIDDNADAIDALETVAASKSDKDHTHNTATTSAAGFMSASDKTTLNNHANLLAASRSISLNGRVSGSTTFTGSGNISITTTDAQHISEKNSGAYYFPLATMVKDDAGNYGNITITGRIGGWEQSNSANFEIMMLNRSSARDGNTITATVSASGEVETAFTKCDIVVYRQDDTSAKVYLKTASYWLFDFDWSVFQHSVIYDGSKSADTPAGTLIWSLSTAPKTILDAKGNFSSTGSNVSFGRKAGTTTGNPSVALGKDTVASNVATTAVGAYCEAKNDYATAVGYNAKATGQQATAIGTSAQATGKQSVALGCNNVASNEYSFATGCWTTSKGIAASAFGNGSSANGWTAFASGIVTTARGNAQHVFGSYNIPDTTITDAQLAEDYSLRGGYLIIVGNGNSSAKSNAHTLDWSGNAWYAGDVADGYGNTIRNHWHSGFTGGSCELNIQGKLFGYGGFIDFHYHDADGNPTDANGTIKDKTPDYTTRLIEDAPGRLSLYGKLKVSSELSIGQGDGNGIQLGTNGRFNATYNGADDYTVLGMMDGVFTLGSSTIPTELRGGTYVHLGNELRVDGSDAAGSSKVVFVPGKGQITDSGTSTLFGFTASKDISVGHSSYVLKLRGSATRPTYNGTNMVISSDLTNGTFDSIVLKSSVSGSSKKFKITVNDSGQITASAV